MTDYADVPDDVLVHMRASCAALPEAYEEQAWAGTRWRIRKRTFVHVLTLDSPKGPTTIMTFRSAGEELEALEGTGHPFFRARWGTNVMGMVIDAAVDWDEVRELVTESYCIMAPKRLAAAVNRPAD